MKKLITILILLLILPINSSAATAFVRVTEGTADATTLTLNIQSSGAERVLVFGVAYKSNSPMTPTSLTFNGSENFVIEHIATDAANVQAFLAYLIAPTVTTADVVLTMSSSLRMVGYTALFTGIDQTNPFTANTVDAQGTNAAPTVNVTSASDEIVVDIMGQVSAGPDTATLSHNLLANGASTGGGTDTRGAGQYVAGTGTRTMDYSMSGSEDWTIVAGALQPAGAPTPSATDIVNDATLSTSLVSCWEMDEESGTRIDTVTGNSNDLTDNNSVLFGSGIVAGNSADIERDTTESLSIDDVDQSGLDLSSDISFSSWINFESFTGAVRMYFISKRDGDSDAYLWAFDPQNDLLFFLTDGLVSVSWNPLVATDYHVMVTKNGSTVQFFVDNVQQGTDKTLSSATITNTNDAFYIGQNGNNVASDQGMDGLMDVVVVWDKELSEQERVDLFNAGSGIPCDVGVVAEIKKQTEFWFD